MAGRGTSLDKVLKLCMHVSGFFASYVLNSGWFNKPWNYSRRMIDNAWEWAEKHHKKRKNPVHQEEEICFVLDDEFLFRSGEWSTYDSEW